MAAPWMPPFPGWLGAHIDERSMADQKRRLRARKMLWARGIPRGDIEELWNYGEEALGKLIRKWLAVQKRREKRAASVSGSL